MRFTSDAVPPYHMTWVRNSLDAQKWLTLKLEDGYILESANGATIPGLMQVNEAIFLTVRYDPEAVDALVKRCNG